VELLIAVDNQTWMPCHIGNSQVEGDNLRLIQSVLGPVCILMGSAKMVDPGDGTQGPEGSAEGPAKKAPALDETSAKNRPGKMIRPGREQQQLLLMDCVQKMLTVMLVLLARMPEGVAF
jgi:hypothetical protein